MLYFSLFTLFSTIVFAEENIYNQLYIFNADYYDLLDLTIKPGKSTLTMSPIEPFTIKPGTGGRIDFSSGNCISLAKSQGQGSITCDKDVNFGQEFEIFVGDKQSPVDTIFIGATGKQSSNYLNSEGYKYTYFGPVAKNELFTPNGRDVSTYCNYAYANKTLGGVRGTVVMPGSRMLVGFFINDYYGFPGIQGTCREYDALQMVIVGNPKDTLKMQEDNQRYIAMLGTDGDYKSLISKANKDLTMSKMEKAEVVWFLTISLSSDKISKDITSYVDNQKYNAKWYAVTSILSALTGQAYSIMPGAYTQYGNRQTIMSSLEVLLGDPMSAKKITWPGPYNNTCSNAQFHYNTMLVTANCLTDENNIREASIYPLSCFGAGYNGQIINDGGYLKCAIAKQF